VSAAPSPIPQQPSDRKPAICKVPLSMFEGGILSICNFTQVKCFCHVLNETTAPDRFGKNRTWSRIKPAEFAEISRTSEDWAMVAVDSLIKSGLLQTEDVDGMESKRRYRISPDLTAETKAAPIRGKCKECQWVGMFRTEFVPLPRTAFTKLAPAVDHATFVCTMVVARFTHHWNTERGLWGEPSELTPHDFRLTGLEPGMVKEGLDSAVELGLIKRRNRAGKSSIYESCPENWAMIEKRPLREVTPPVRGAKDEAKEPSSTGTEKPIKEPVTPPIESGVFRTAVCPKCERIVEVEAIADDVQLSESLPAEKLAPDKPPRVISKTEKKPVSREEATWNQLREWHTRKTVLKP
jgi:hypothetical protein